MTKEENVLRQRNCILKLCIVLCVCVGFLVQIYGFFKLFTYRNSDGLRICNVLMRNKDCQQFRKMSDDLLTNSNKTAPQMFRLEIEDEKAYNTFVILEAIAVVFHSCALLLVIHGMLSHFMMCCCPLFGLSFLTIFEFFTGIFCVTGCLILSLSVSPKEIRQIQSFYYFLSNGIFCILQVTVVNGFVLWEKKTIDLTSLTEIKRT